MKELYESIAMNGCVFIGAGISNLLGFPLWKTFTLGMLEFTWQQRGAFGYEPLEVSVKEELADMIQRDKLIDVITFCKDIFKKNDCLTKYYQYVEQTFNDANKYKAINNNAYAALHRLSSRLFFLQTNIDCSLEIYFANVNRTAPRIFLNKHLPVDIGDIPAGAIIYLHGKVTQRDSIIFTTDEYDELYERQPAVREFLVKLFNNRTVLFLGYSLSDKEILQTVARSYLSKTHYLGLASKRRDLTKEKIFSSWLIDHYNIRTVEYDVEAGYEKIVDFIANIDSEISKVMTSPLVPPKDRSKPI